MTTTPVQDIAYQIERLKLLKVLDWTWESESWYEAEIEVLKLDLKKLLQTP